MKTEQTRNNDKTEHRHKINIKQENKSKTE